LLINPQLTKVFHAAGEDIGVLSYFCQIKPTSFTQIFDTQVAAAFLNLDLNIGYAKLVKLLLDIEINKDQTTTNWLIRPLNDEQINYAILDVYYLYKLYLILKKELLSIKYNWILEESLIKHINYYNNEQNNYLNIKNAWKLNRTGLAVLRNLYIMRENLAKNKDIPRNWIINNDDLFILANKLPTKLQHINKLNNISNIKPYINNILTTINNTLKQDINSYPQLLSKPLNKQQNIRYDYLKDKIKQLADKYQINYNLILPKTILKEFIITNKIPNSLNGFKYELLYKLLADNIKEQNNKINNN